MTTSNTAYEEDYMARVTFPGDQWSQVSGFELPSGTTFPEAVMVPDDFMDC